MIRSRSPIVLALGLTVGMTFAGGLAVASSTGAQVKTCVQKKTGLVRVASKCKKSEKTLTLGQVGPQGAPGATGAQGVAGVAGAPGVQGLQGPSNVFSYVYNRDGTGTQPAPPPLTGPATGTLLTLPPGTYAVTWTMGISTNAITTASYFGCTPSYSPSGGTAFTTGYYDVGTPGSSSFGVGSASMQDVVSLTASTTVILTCFSAGGAGTVQNFSVTALKVGSATGAGIVSHVAGAASQSGLNAR